MQITPRQAAQRLLDALAAAMPHAPHCGEFDRVADAADDLRAALKREKEALAPEVTRPTRRAPTDPKQDRAARRGGSR